MTTNELLKSFLKISDEVEKSSEEFLNLSYNQINWRTSDSQWSIGECFEHLIRTNSKYIPEFQKNKLHSVEKINMNFKHTLIGKFLINSMKPNNKRETKTPVSFNPIGSIIKESIVKDFLNQNKEIVEQVKNIDPAKLKIKITSPFAKFVRYNIGDSLLIIANHNLRHIGQAGRVMQNEKFPFS